MKQPATAKDLLEQLQENVPGLDLLVCEKAFAGLPPEVTSYLEACRGIPKDMLERMSETEQEVIRAGLLSHMFMTDIIGSRMQ